VSEHGALPDPQPIDWPAFWLWMVRWGLGILIIVVGIAILFVIPDSSVALEISGMTIGAGTATILVGWLVRMGNSGDVERDAEEDARSYYDKHGRWPDDG
jgi:hypothetical protein